MANILLVEDDQSLGTPLKSLLDAEGYKVTWCKDLSDARSNNANDFQVVVLDWMLPDGQGIDYLRELRQKNIMIPTIMLTARVDMIDKILGLETGANDYMTKPFEPRELIARIRVQLRNHGVKSSSQSQDDSSSIIRGKLKILIDSMELFYDEKKIDLTKMEFELIKLLAESPARVFSREELLNKVWGYENYPTTRTVDTHVLQLRQKLPEDIIETRRGIGYRFRSV